jgi:Kef-type K+ transport system membrane component KefB
LIQPGRGPNDAGVAPLFDGGSIRGADAQPRFLRAAQQLVHTASILLQVALAIVLATTLAIAAKALRQPVILGYIAAGVLAGPSQGFGWISPEAIEPISELGLVLLLFMIGLEIDLKKLRNAGKAVVLVGVVQFPACVLIGLLLFTGIGLGEGYRFGAWYLAVAAALSSTMIVVKLLYDKNELDTLPGRITLGTLVLQDLWAILFLALQPNLDDPRIAALLTSLAKVALLIAFALLISRYVLPLLFRFIAKVPELMLIGSLAWCFLVAIVAERLGLSLEMGALIAGVSVSTFPYNLDVIAKVVSLRDFFVTLFFVALGTQVARPSVEIVGAALAGAGIVVITRFLTISPLLYALRQGNRVSFLPALNLAQVSEFSLVIGSLGVALGHIGDLQLSIIVYMMVLTALTSTYTIQFNHEIFDRVSPWLQRMGMRERLQVEAGPSADTAPPRPLVLVGFWRDASSVLHELLRLSPSIAPKIGVIDFNPEVSDELSRRGIAATYGDVAHVTTLEHANVEHADVLVCTLPDAILKGTTNARLMKQLQSLAPDARLILTADRFAVARELYQEGAAWVYMPRLHSAREAAEVILLSMQGDPREARERALIDLAARREVIP